MTDPAYALWRDAIAAKHERECVERWALVVAVAALRDHLAVCEKEPK